MTPPSKVLKKAEVKNARPGLSVAERAKLVRRCIAMWRDLEVSRAMWKSRFPADIRDEARHTMSYEDLRLRG